MPFKVPVWGGERERERRSVLTERSNVLRKRQYSFMQHRFCDVSLGGSKSASRDDGRCAIITFGFASRRAFDGCIIIYTQKIHGAGGGRGVYYIAYRESAARREERRNRVTRRRQGRGNIIEHVHINVSEQARILLHSAR